MLHLDYNVVTVGRYCGDLTVAVFVTFIKDHDITFMQESGNIRRECK